MPRTPRIPPIPSPKPHRYGAPDEATPAWSRELALLQRSPYWRTGPQQHRGRFRDFAEAAVQYATAADLPPDLRTIYRAARAANGGGSSNT